jgi:hypothetical protein
MPVRSFAVTASVQSNNFKIQTLLWAGGKCFVSPLPPARVQKKIN